MMRIAYSYLPRSHLLRRITSKSRVPGEKNPGIVEGGNMIICPKCYVLICSDGMSFLHMTR